MLEGVLDAVAGLPPVVCYHYPCPDGAFAALAAYLYYKQVGVPVKFAPQTVFRELTLEDLSLKGDEVVYFLDYSGPKGFVQKVSNHCKRVIVLDHHKTAAEQLGEPADLPGNVDVLLDMDRCGATIALDFFKPKGLSEQLQKAYKYVEDADLWRWKVAGSRAFHAGLADLRLDYDAGKGTEVLDQLAALDPQQVIEKGEGVLQKQEQVIAEAVDNAEVLQLGGPQGRDRDWGQALGCLVTGDLIGWRSTLGNRLAIAGQERGLRPAGVVVYREAGMDDDKLKVSIRGVGDYDTTVITQALGGGGHKGASSCIIDADDFQSWRQI